MSAPLWTRGYLRHDGPARIETAVRAAERRTRGEIVPVLARRSAPWRHAAWTAGLLVLAGLLLSSTRLWDAWLPWGPSVWPLLLDLLAAALAGWALGRLALVQRLLTPAKDRDHAVHAAAQAAFYELGLDRTQGATGILLYVSLAERKAVVLADKAIAAKLPPHTWDQVCALLLQGAARRDLAAGFEAAIDRCAAILEKPFPNRRRRDRDELANRLRWRA